MSGEDPQLSDNEGTLLALVVREQPITPYQVRRVYQDSPVSNFNTSPGKIYPLIRRLQQRGLLDAKGVSGDRRGTERLECTEAGRSALKEWLKHVRPHHLMLEDPLRTKLQSFDLLNRDEQIQWVVDVKTMLSEKLDEVERYSRDVIVPYQDLVHDNAVRTLRARMDWLDRVLRTVVKQN